MDKLKPQPHYETPIGNVKPATVSAVGYGVASLITITACTHAVLAGYYWMPSRVGTALWVGVIAAILTSLSIRAHQQGWDW